MKQFTDNDDRAWSISLTIDAVKRVRDLLGINLLDIEAGEPPLITRLATDEILLCDVIFCLVKPQADSQGITDTEFGQSLGGDAILAAQQALYQELVDFFQKRGRTDRAQALTKQQKVMDKAIAYATAQVVAIDLDKIASGKLSMNSPGPSASSPAS